MGTTWHNRITYRCASTALARATRAACGPFNRSFDPVKTPIVTSSQLSHDVPVYSGGLGSAGAKALDDWFASIRLGYSDRVTIDDPDALGSSERRAALAEVVGRYGLLLDETAPSTSGSVEIVRASCRERGCK